MPIDHKIHEIRLWLEIGKVLLKESLDLYQEIEDHLEYKIKEYEDKKDEQRGS